MIGLLFSFALVGVPAFAGAYFMAHPTSDRDRSTGFGLLIYAAAVVLLYFFWNPDGKIFLANFRVKMPLAFVLSAATGFSLGLSRR